MGKGSNRDPGPTAAGWEWGCLGPPAWEAKRAMVLSAPAGPGKYYVKSSLHTIKGHGEPGSRNENQLEA